MQNCYSAENRPNDRNMLHCSTRSHPSNFSKSCFDLLEYFLYNLDLKFETDFDSKNKQYFRSEVAGSKKFLKFDQSFCDCP